MKPILLTTVALVFPLITSCGEREDESPASSVVSPPSKALMAVLDAKVTGEPTAIHNLRATAKPGDEVVLSGRVMGSLHPFVEGRAALILGDPEILTACSEIEGDSCDTPWDVCCDSVEDKKRGTATIQIINANGRVLKEELEGVGGIGKLSRLMVSGIVAEGSSADLLVINAKAIDAIE